MRRCFKLFKTLALMAAVVVSLSATARVAGQTSSNKAVTASLQKVQETRRIVLVSKEKENSGFGMFSKPRLELILNLTVPGGKKILDVTQPKTIVAKDSAGRDLTDVKPSFSGEKKFVEINRFMSGDAQQCTLTLAPPARSASSFDLKATFDVWVHNDIKVVPFTPTAKGVSLDASALGIENAMATITQAGGQTQVIIKPGTVKRKIKRVVLLDGDKEISNMGTMWNDTSITYMFNAPGKKQYQAKADVYVGLEQLPCTIDLTHQPLP